MNVFLSLVLQPNPHGYIKITLFPGKLEECIPERRDKWKVIECVLSLVLQPNPHGYIEITLFPGKLEECISERNYSSV